MIFTALTALELARVHREKLESKSWHQWIETEWPMGEETARQRVRLGEVLERKAVELGHDANLEWFRSLGSVIMAGGNLTDDDRAGACRIINDLAPAALNSRQLLIECGILPKPPEKETPVIDIEAKVRKVRELPAPHVRLGKSWSKIAEPDRIAFVIEHLDEIRALLLRLEVSQ